MKYYIIYCLILLGIIFIYQFWYRWFSKRLNTTLFKKLNANKFLKMLDSIEAKILLTYKKRLILKIDGYALENNIIAMQETFTILEKLHLNKALQITLYQKEIAFFIDTIQNTKASNALEEFKKVTNNINNPQIKKIYHQSELLVDTYCNFKKDIINELNNQIKENSNNKIVATINYYRIAFIYNYYKDDKTTDKFLKLAKKNSSNSLISKHLANCLNDHNNLNLKQI